MRRADHTAHAQQFLSGEVAAVLCHFAVVQSLQQGGIVHQLAAGEVQHPDAVFAHVQRLRVDGVAREGQIGNMDGQIIALGQHVAQADAVIDAAGQAPRGVDGDVRVVAQHLHAQRHGGVGHPCADGAQTDNAQGFAAQFGADKLLFALFHILGDGGAALEALRPVDGVHHVAAAGNQRAHHQLGHRVGVGARRVKDHDALLGAFVDGNVVGARTRTGDGQQAVGQRHVVHVGAAHQNAVGVVHIVVDLELAGGQLGQTHRRDGVERFDGIHTGSPY